VASHDRNRGLSRARQRLAFLGGQFAGYGAGDGGTMKRPFGEARLGAPVWCWVLCVPVVGATACNKKGTDSAGVVDCNVEITDRLPAAGSTEACYDTAIEFEIAGGDVDAVITLTDSSGAEVAGKTIPNADGSVVVFVPDAPLAPSSAYTATLDYCLGTDTVPFTTSVYGEPLADPAGLVDSVYVVDIRDPDLARFNKPKGVSMILQPQLSRLLALQVLAPTSASAITMRLAVLDEDGTSQDPCVPTVDFESGTLDGPRFHIGPKDITLIVAGDAVDIGNLEATGTFAPDGSSFGCAGFTGLVDTRPLVPLVLDEKSKPDELCRLVGNYGAECVACTDGEPVCLDLEVDHASGAGNEAIVIVPITDADVKANPECVKD
jgi:hypothetical protein